MDVLVTYDVSTETPEGRRRLRRVAKACEGWGQRVQKSVFECRVSDAQLELFRARLLKELDPAQDSLRIYRLPGGRGAVVEEYGTFKAVDFDAPLIV